MLRFCDAGVAASDSSAEAFVKADVRSANLRTTWSVFLPAPLVVRVRALHPIGLAWLPQLDTPLGQSLA